MRHRKEALGVLVIVLILLVPLVHASGSKMTNKHKYLQCWDPISTQDLPNMPYIRNNPSEYLNALLSLDVANNYRYEPKAVISSNGKTYRVPYVEYKELSPLMNASFLYKETYCNIYCIDVSRVLGIELPQMLAEQMFYWAQQSSHWQDIPYQQAITNANRGIPTMMIMAYPNQIGHVAMVRPSTDAMMHVVQAGSTCSNDLVWKDRDSSYVKYFSYRR